MNGKKARKLRMKVFGDSGVGKTTYATVLHPKKVWQANEKEERVLVEIQKEQVVCTGARAEYQEAKRR